MLIIVSVERSEKRLVRMSVQARGAGRWPLATAYTVLALLAGAASAADEGRAMDQRLDLLFGEHEPYRAFLSELQRAVADEPREEVTGLVAYPLKARLNGRTLMLRTPADFRAHYRELLPGATRTKLATQPYGALFANSRGVMAGEGQLWFAAACSDPGVPPAPSDSSLSMRPELIYRRTCIGYP